MAMLDRLRRRWRGELAKRGARVPAPLALDRPTLSVTFDDFLATAAETGAAVLEAAGVRGSFYVNGGTIGGRGELGPSGDAALLRAVHAAGHEIGCHSFSHADLFRLDAAGIGAEMDRNAAWLEAQLGERPRSFAYPYGRAPLRAKRAAMARYRAARSVQPGLNEGEIDLAYIRAVPLESVRRDRELLARFVEEAVRRRAWLVLYTHDVQPDPGPYGVTPADLDWVVRAALAAGCAVRPLGEVVAGP
ncbi:MAG: polysaccharide deacetylase family protein [Roseococcus sp.]|nr:polysaccharide deacetylase family protein [Roseococcus sp.]